MNEQLKINPAVCASLQDIVSNIKLQTKEITTDYPWQKNVSVV